MDSPAGQAHPRREDGQQLSSGQAREAAYRYVARYYDYQRTAPILHLLEAIAMTTDDPGSHETAWEVWEACVEETLDHAVLPPLAPPWDD